MIFDDFWSGVDCSIGAAATGEFHALGDACKSGLLYLHETSPPEANLKPSRRRDSPILDPANWTRGFWGG